MSKLAEDEGIYGVDDRCVFTERFAIFTDQTGSFTLFNLLTRTLVTKVKVDLQEIKSSQIVILTPLMML